MLSNTCMLELPPARFEAEVTDLRTGPHALSLCSRSLQRLLAAFPAVRSWAPRARYQLVQRRNDGLAFLQPSMRLGH